MPEGNGPATVEVLFVEGGEWQPFVPGVFKTNIHAIKFENGAIWDVVNGWRKTTNGERQDDV